MSLQPERIASATLHIGDCLDVLPQLAAEGFRAHAVVTDPPYHLIAGGLSLNNMAHKADQPNRRRNPGGFMNAEWDGGDVAFRPETWRAVFECMLPGAHLLAFSGTRTSHRMVCAIEDAGFEIRDTLMWVYGSGYPKSLNVSKAIDRNAGRIAKCILDLKHRLAAAFDASGKSRGRIDAECGFRASNYLTLPAEGKRPDPWVNVLPTAEKWAKMKAVLGVCGDDALDLAFAAAEREVIGRGTNGIASGSGEFVSGNAGTAGYGAEFDITAPATPEAAAWNGWGTALKPSYEPIILARKPLSEGTVAANVLRHGTGAINVDACRVGTTENTGRPGTISKGGILNVQPGGCVRQSETHPAGRWPANLVLSDDPEVEQAFAAFGESAPSRAADRGLQHTGRHGGLADLAPNIKPGTNGIRGHNDVGGSASRFFQKCGYTQQEKEWSEYINASDAGKTIDLQSELAASALSHAVELSTASLALSLASYQAPSTSVTASELRTICASVTALTLNIAGKCSQEWPHGKLTLSNDPVFCVAQQKRTGTTRITISLWKSGGYVDVATFNITETNSEHGEPGLAGASRFHYTAKADANDRAGSKHPTVKPASLMRWLVRLVCPPGGTILDPFAGTGSTGLAADQCGMRSVLIERDPTYAGDALRKIREDAPLFAEASPEPQPDAAYQRHGDLFADAAD